MYKPNQSVACTAILTICGIFLFSSVVYSVATVVLRHVNSGQLDNWAEGLFITGLLFGFYAIPFMLVKLLCLLKNDNNANMKPIPRLMDIMAFTLLGICFIAMSLSFMFPLTKLILFLSALSVEFFVGLFAFSCYD